jgi:hypothetical protein
VRTAILIDQQLEYSGLPIEWSAYELNRDAVVVHAHKLRRSLLYSHPYSQAGRRWPSEGDPTDEASRSPAPADSGRQRA